MLGVVRGTGRFVGRVGALAVALGVGPAATTAAKAAMPAASATAVPAVGAVCWSATPVTAATAPRAVKSLPGCRLPTTPTGWAGPSRTACPRPRSLGS